MEVISEVTKKDGVEYVDIRLSKEDSDFMSSAFTCIVVKEQQFYNESDPTDKTRMQKLTTLEKQAQKVWETLHSN